MIPATYIVTLLIGIFLFFLGNNRIKNICMNENKKPHSLNIYHGLFPAILSIVPPLILLSLWITCDDVIFDQMLKNRLPNNLIIEGNQTFLILLAAINNIADGIIVGEPERWMMDLAQKLIIWRGHSDNLISIITIICSFAFGLYALSFVKIDFRARNAVEKLIMIGLIICSLIAIITTIGIIFSVIFESIRFFKLVPIFEFLTGLTWNPEFEGQLELVLAKRGCQRMGQYHYLLVLFSSPLLH